MEAIQLVSSLFHERIETKDIRSEGTHESTYSCDEPLTRNPGYPT